MFLLINFDPLNLLFTLLSSSAFAGVLVAIFVTIQKVSAAYLQRQKERELILKNGDLEVILKGHSSKEECAIIKQLSLKNSTKQLPPAKQIEPSNDEQD